MNTASHDAQRFVEAMRVHFDAQTIAPRSEGNPVVWVNAGVSGGGDAVLLYRQYAGGPLVGRRWNLSELGVLFGTDDSAKLAEDMWVNEVEDPDVGGQHLDVDWAVGLIDNPDVVLWRGEHPVAESSSRPPKS